MSNVSNFIVDFVLLEIDHIQTLYTIYMKNLHFWCFNTYLTNYLYSDKPVCEGERSKVFGVARGEVLSINCTGRFFSSTQWFTITLQVAEQCGLKEEAFLSINILWLYHNISLNFVWFLLLIWEMLLVSHHMAFKILLCLGYSIKTCHMQNY